MNNTVVQTPQGKEPAYQERLHHILSFSLILIFFNLIDVNSIYLFSKAKTESDKENYILSSQVLAEIVEMLACPAREWL